MQDAQQDARYVSLLTRRSLALVMAGGRGSRLEALTSWRAKPAVPFGGKFKIVDFPLSNCVNSGIRRIGVLTQYKSHSLIRHLQLGWSMFQGQFHEFVEIMPAQQRLHERWYAGTADAVYQNLDIIRHHDPDHVVILAGDHIYKMDYGLMIAAHVEHGCEITVGSIEVPLADARAFGVMRTDEKGQVLEFMEKPESPTPIPGKPDMALASMGIYVFSTDYLIDRLEADAGRAESSRDFGKDIIPQAIETDRVCAFPFREAATGGPAYWRDVGTVDSFWRANIELTAVQPELNLYDEEWPIWTHQRQVPPAKFVFEHADRRGIAMDSLISGGCIVAGATVRRSLMFPMSTVQSHSLVEDSVVMPNVHIGERCVVRRAVIDEFCQIPDGTQIGVDPVEDARRFYVTAEGITLVTAEMLGQPRLFV